MHEGNHAFSFLHVLFQEPYNHVTFKVINCAQANRSPPVTAHQCMLNHTWSLRVTCVGGYINKAEPISSPSCICFPKGLELNPSGITLSSWLSRPDGSPLRILSLLCCPLVLSRRLLILQLSACIFSPSVHKKSNKAKAVQQEEEPGRNTLQALNWIQV